MGNRHGKKESECLQKVINSIEEVLFSRISLDKATEIYKLLKIAKANPKSSEFPDFLIKNGFIEHFEVSASKVNKKNSSDYREKEAHFSNIECIEKSKEVKEKLETTMKPGELYTEDSILEYYSNTYDNYLTSFKRNCDHHIESLHKFDGNKDIGIFLVEMCGSMGGIQR